MKYVLKTKVWPVIAGLLTAFIIMMIFEYANSYLYPLPVGLDLNDPAAVRAFTASLPWTVYVLVFLGWIIGSFKAGFITTYISNEPTYRLSFAVGALLTIVGLINNLMIGHDVVFTAVSLPLFIVFTYAGHRTLRSFRRSRGNEVASIPSL